MTQFTILSDEQRAAANAQRERALALELSQQSALRGLLGGLAAAVVGGAVWGGITVATEFQIGWMAVGVGFLVGCAVRVCGKGNTAIFGLIGACCALLGCILGNLFAGCGFVAKALSMPYFHVLWRTIMSPKMTFELLRLGFSGMDVLFYAIALYEGQKFAAMGSEDD